MRNRGVGKRDEPDSRAWVARKDQVGIAVNTHTIVRMEVAAKAGSTMDERAFVGSGERVLMKVHTCGNAKPQVSTRQKPVSRSKTSYEGQMPEQRGPVADRLAK